MTCPAWLAVWPVGAGRKAMISGDSLPDDGNAKPRWAEWAALYGSSERTLKRWAALGRDQGDECPLGTPPEMPGWWSRNMAQRIPHKVLLAAGPEAVVTNPVLPDESLPVKPADMGDFVGATDAEMGIEATLKRLEDSEVFAHRTYKDAISRGDSNRSLIAERSFRQLAKEKVLVEEKVRDARIKSRDLIPREEAEARIADVHGDLILRFRGLADRFCRAYALPVSAENEAKWLDLVDEFCIALREGVLS